MNKGDVGMETDEENASQNTGIGFEPKILVFSCNWCSYTSADLAGINRYTYPHNIIIIRFMCSGRIEPEFIMKALEYGADGVMVTGCRLDDCHYISGNFRAKERIETTQALLDMLGLEPSRLDVQWLSASEGEKFAQTMNDFVKRIVVLGPNPLKSATESKVD